MLTFSAIISFENETKLNFLFVIITELDMSEQI